MEQVDCAEVGAAEVLTVVECAYACAGLGHLGLYLGKLVVEPCVHLLAAVLYGQLGDVEVNLERSLAEEVEQIPVMEGAQEAHLGAVLAVLVVVGHLRQVAVEQCDVIRQTGVSPLHAHAARVPAYHRYLRNVGVGLPSPHALVGRQLLKVERCTVEARLTLVEAEVAVARAAPLAGKAEHAVAFSQQAHCVGIRRRLRIDRTDVQIVGTAGHSKR